MLTEKLLILVVVVGAVMALAGGSALFAEENKDQGSGVVWAVIRALANRLASIAEEEVATEHTPPAFEVLHIKANADVKVHLADTPRIVITAPSSLHEKIKLWTESNKLEIRMAEKSRRFSVDVYCPPLSEIGAADNAILEFSGDVTRSEFKVGQLGSSTEIRGSLDCETIRLDMVGSGTILLTGSAQTARINMIGDGTIDVQNLMVNKTNANIVGKGKILTWTTDNLSVLGVGSGTIHYRGTPSVHSLDTGSVRVIKLPDADTSDTSYSTQPVPKPIDSALTLTYTVLGKPQSMKGEL